MILGQAIQRIRNYYEAGVPSDDSRLSVRRVYHALNTARAYVVNQLTSRAIKVDEGFYQNLCIELEPVSCKGCYDYVGELPDLLYDKKEPLLSVYLNGERLLYVKWDNYRNLVKSSLMPSKGVYTVNGNKLYVSGSNIGDQVDVKAVLTNPLDVYQYDACMQGGQCPNYMLFDYPLPDSYFDMVFDQIKKLEMLIPYEDTRNNSKQDRSEMVTGQSKE